MDDWFDSNQYITLQKSMSHHREIDNHRTIEIHSRTICVLVNFQIYEMIFQIQISDFWNLKHECVYVSHGMLTMVSDFRFQNFRNLKWCFRFLKLNMNITCVNRLCCGLWSVVVVVFVGGVVIHR